MSRPGSFRKAQIAVFQEDVLCDKHHEKVTLFCTNCSDLVCARCIVNKHNGHNFKGVEEIVGEKHQKLITVINNLENIEVPQLKKILDETRLRTSEEETNSQVLLNAINNRADELVSGINKARNNLLEEVKQFHQQDNDKFTKIEKKLEELLIEKEEIIAQYKKALMSPNDSKIVQLTLKLDQQAVLQHNELRTDLKSVKRREFIPGYNLGFRGVLGQCIEWNEDSGNSQSSDHVTKTKLEVMSEFQHGNGEEKIKAIATIDDQAWVATFQGTDVKRLDKTGQVRKTLRFSTKISDLATTDDGCLFVIPNGGSEGHECQIKKVKRKGEIVTFIDTNPLVPSCICTSPTGLLYVGCIDSYNFDVNENSTRSVIKHSRDGVQRKEWQFDESQKRIFTLPYKVQTNNKDLIWVVDRKTPSRGRVVVLHDQEDGTRFIYNGIMNDKTIKWDFNPSDLTAAGDGTMLISDLNNNTIHVVDENGVPLYLLGSQYQRGLYGVTAICFNRYFNALWVGNLKGYIQLLKVT